MSSYSPGTIGQAESPVVEKTFHQRWAAQTARSSLRWGLVNICCALLLCFEIFFCKLWSLSHVVFWYVEVGLALMFVISIALDFLRYLYLGLSVSTSPVFVNDLQRTLLAISKSDAGFQSPVLSSKTQGTGDSSPGPIYSPSIFSPDGRISPFSMSQTSPYSRTRSSPGMYSGTPVYSGHSPHSQHSQSYMLDRSSSFTGAHGSGSASYLGGSFHEQSVSMGSMGHSTSFSKGGASPLTPSSTLSPLFHESIHAETPTSGNYGLRSRFNLSSPLQTPSGSPEDCMTDLRSLQTFLQDQEQQQDMKSQMASADLSAGSSPSFWSYGRSFMDYTPLLRKYQYQIACKSPQSAKSSSKDDNADDSITYGPDEVWRQMGVQMYETDRWVENLRKWLRATILLRVVEEIDRINKQLIRIGCDDMQIGEVAISTLKQLAVTKTHQVPTLNLLIPYLEVSTNQEYLVHRLKELASGGCMSPFKWNGGGEFKGKAWEENLPTDACIVMHALCTYMDSRLPPHPKYPDRKTFTSQHFMQTPEKPSHDKKDYCCIYQSSINPPHYKVLIEDDTLNPRKGRNNMFHAILLFFHHIKTKEHGMLGRVNLGMSGINICWIFDEV